MQWNEPAIILSARKFGESNLLVEVFAESKGLYSGMVRGGQSKSKFTIFQAGNIVEATWRSRLEDQLGTFTAEVTNSVSGKVIHDSLKLLSLISLTSLLRKTLIDRNPYNDLYECLFEFLTESLHEEKWIKQYVWMEIALLRYLGFGLDLSNCAVTGRTEGLAYVSPRTGRAATAEASKGYEDKLFKLPEFLVNGSEPDMQQISQALEMTGYFLEKSMFEPHNRKLPDERRRFLSKIEKNILLSVA